MPNAKDDADTASEQEQRFRDEALWRSTQSKRLVHRGSCYHCGESASNLFCDIECRRDYEHARKVRQRQQAQQRNDQEHAA